MGGSFALVPTEQREKGGMGGLVERDGGVAGTVLGQG
jgi:hypothetical protein